MADARFLHDVVEPLLVIHDVVEPLLVIGPWWDTVGALGTTSAPTPVAR